MEDAGGGKIGRPGSNCGWNKNCRRFEILKYFLTWKFQIREIIDQVEQLETHFR